MRARVAINNVECGEVDEAERRYQSKSPAPAEVHHSEGDQRHADHVREFRRRIEEGRGRSTLLPRKPIARRFGIGGEAGGFGNPQQKTEKIKLPHRATADGGR